VHPVTTIQCIGLAPQLAFSIKSVQLGLCWAKDLFLVLPPEIRR
jgi:hypothetical protein